MPGNLLGDWGLGTGDSARMSLYAKRPPLALEFQCAEACSLRGASLPSLQSPSPQSPLGFFLLPFRRDLEARRRALCDARLGDLHLDHVLAARQLEHYVHEDLLE